VARRSYTPSSSVDGKERIIMALHSAVVDGLNAQMGREFEAHLQYLAISSWFDGEGLPELTGFFAAQAAEEHQHAMKFLTYIQDAGGTVAIPGLAAPTGRFASAEDAVAAALDSENDVTARIHQLVDLARENNDHATEVFLQWFVTEQVEEVATMTELLQITRRAGDGGLLLVEDYIARSGGHTAAE
jgi:ferritin